MENNLSLLRAFDLALAQTGTPLCTKDGRPCRFIAGPDVDGDLCVEHSTGGFGVAAPGYYRMAPLCWVEGRPVYPGDVLHVKDGEIGSRRTVIGIEVSAPGLRFEETDVILHPSCLTWMGKKSAKDEIDDLFTLLDSSGIPQGPIGWRVREYRREAEKAHDLMLDALKDCVAVMSCDLKGLACIQNELQQAKDAIAKVQA